MCLRKSNIRSHQLDVQEANVSITFHHGMYKVYLTVTIVDVVDEHVDQTSISSDFLAKCRARK